MTQQTTTVKQTLTLTYVVTIELPAVPPLTAITVELPGMVQGQPYSCQLLVSGGIPPYTFEQETMPAGLSCSMTGLIQGTPTTAGQAEVKVKVTDSGV